MVLSQDILLPILLVTIVANVAIVAVLLATGRFGRGKSVATASSGDTFDGAILSTSYVDRSAGASWPAAATDSGVAVDGDGDGTDADDGGPDEADPAALADPAAMADPAAPIALIASQAEGNEPDGPAASAEGGPQAGPDDGDPADPVETGIDALTGLPDAAAFHRLVADEDARIARYQRPATIVIVELEGLERLVDRLGSEAAERIVPPVADTLRRLARGADHVGRLGPGRFGVLLPETDEVSAINYVERIRRACELWLESGAIALQLAIGWAGTSGDPTLTEAQRIALERMYVEMRRAARRAGVDDPSDRMAS